MNMAAVCCVNGSGSGSARAEACAAVSCEEAKYKGDGGIEWRVAGWEKVAVVSDVDWLETAVKAFGWMMPGEVKVFESDDVRDAKAWLNLEYARRLWKGWRDCVAHSIFQQGILLCIFINTFSMGIEYHDQPETLTRVILINMCIDYA